MDRKIDPTLKAILQGYDCTEDDIWDCHGTWVAYHRTLEKIAAKAGISYETPTVLVAERDAAAIMVTGRLKDRTEWSIGEAVINQNYKVSGKQAGYPFAMAEKRAKDRVIIKLVGLHGVYSEEEADDFKPASTATTKAEPEDRAVIETLLMAMRQSASKAELDGWYAKQKPAIRDLPPAHKQEFIRAIEAFAPTLPETLDEAA